MCKQDLQLLPKLHKNTKLGKLFFKRPNNLKPQIAFDQLVSENGNQHPMLKRCYN
ncbi:hypothetical protein KSS87_007316 [Heliosperma pusillum]|nr:hypothetical protein KSS87_007316 [Heliosperma pusillum]